jgi:acetyltransferase-like isoleucine patch superfamily enzyme
MSIGFPEYHILWEVLMGITYLAFCIVICKDARLYAFIKNRVLRFLLKRQGVVLGKNVRFKEFPHIEMRKGGSLIIGDDCTFGYGMSFNIRGSVRLGKRVVINNWTTISATKEIIIDDDVLIGSCVYIVDTIHNTSFHELPIKEIDKRYGWRTSPIHIGKNSWIATNVVLLKSIGEGAVIGANSLVVQEVPDYHLVSCDPARIIGKRI